MCRAFERERPRIVNNFAAKRVAKLRIVILFREMNWTRASNLAMRLEWVTNTQIMTNVAVGLRLPIRILLLLKRRETYR
jgi:hypothetical protein